MEKDITLIIGPTAIGKSALAIAQARKTDAEIISADAFQVYRGMDIGTAKVTKAIRAEITHHLIDIKDPNQDYSVAEFLNLTAQIIQNLRKKKKPIIICGGTGFYMNAFINGFDLPEMDKNPELRACLTKKMALVGTAPLWEELNKIDPKTASLINKNDPKRIIRALEIYTQTKTLPSLLRKQALAPRKDIKIIGLTAPREIIYDNINKRVDQMYQTGLLEEVKSLWQKYGDSQKAFEAIGYKETILCLKGSITKPEMLELVKKKTRNFAKRQLTWYRRFKNVEWIENS
jgi:tRNA dimethylallyltransferase